ncbi:hypothetical protein FOA52_013432 [Chlamydomonas sp. UWO 241]|nr:hypothetical protein FOA52_013432 [Chlamydomonas sp. UWO 241]
MAAEETMMALLQEALVASGAWDGTKHDAYVLRRFLKARSWDVCAARDMWLAMLKWRAAVGADGVLERQLLSSERRARFNALYPHGLHGVDAQGRPVLIYRLGTTNVAGLKKEFPDALLQELHVQTQEFVMRVALPACSLAGGIHVDQITMIVDLEGMGMFDMPKVKELLLPCLSVNGDNYPETLAQLVIVNAPSMFDSAFAVVKRLMSPDTQRKITILGKNYRPALAKLVPRESLPTYMGGTSETGLAENHGPWEKLLHLFTQSATVAAQQEMAQHLHAQQAQLQHSASGPPRTPQHGGHHHALHPSASFGAEAFHSAASDFAASWLSGTRPPIGLHSSLSDLPPATGVGACSSGAAGAAASPAGYHHRWRGSHGVGGSVGTDTLGGLGSIGTIGELGSYHSCLSIQRAHTIGELGSYHSCLSIQESAALFAALQQRAALAAVAEQEAAAAPAMAPVRRGRQRGSDGSSGAGCFAWLCPGRAAGARQPLPAHEGEAAGACGAAVPGGGEVAGRSAAKAPQKPRRAKDYEWDEDEVQASDADAGRGGSDQAAVARGGGVAAGPNALQQVEMKRDVNGMHAASPSKSKGYTGARRSASACCIVS